VPENVILRDGGSYSVASDYCRVTTTDGEEALGLRYCHVDPIGIQTVVASEVTPPGGGTLLLPSRVGDRFVVIALKRYLHETSSTDGRAKVAELKQLKELKRAVDDFESHEVPDRTLPRVDVLAYQPC